MTLGDRYSARDEAQNPANHLGKLVRIMPDGSPYAGNPKKPGWRPEIWSIGHRNVQGAALNPETGKLWTTEHGARGGDEINIPEAGKNYGWPVITYGRDYSYLKIGEGTAKPGLEQPVYYWDPSIAPSGAAFYTGNLFPEWKGNLFVGALAGQALHRLVLDGDKVVGEEKLLYRSRRAHPRRAQRPRRRHLAAHRPPRGPRAARGAGALTCVTSAAGRSGGGTACPGDSERAITGCTPLVGRDHAVAVLVEQRKGGIGLVDHLAEAQAPVAHWRRSSSCRRSRTACRGA